MGTAHLKPFQKGNTMGVGHGRRKGARDKLQTRFIEDLAEAWEKYGKDALVITAREEPAQFVKICSTLMPKEVALDVSGPLNDMSDDELNALLDHVREIRAKLIEQKPLLIDANANAPN